MHIIQGVPIAAWLLSYVLPPSRQKPAVIAILAFAALATLGVFVQALAGYPLVPGNL
jgi:hypothetical protein